MIGLILGWLAWSYLLFGVGLMRGDFPEAKWSEVVKKAFTWPKYFVR